MPDHINFVAISKGYAFFGVAEDPAVKVAALAAELGEPVELGGSWLLMPSRRAEAIRVVKALLALKTRRGDWIRVNREKAISVMAHTVRLHDGKPWRRNAKKVQKAETPTRGAGSPPRAVETPFGKFASISTAAEAIGISRQAVWGNAKRRAVGWRFADDKSPQPQTAKRGRPAFIRNKPKEIS